MSEEDELLVIRAELLAELGNCLFGAPAAYKLMSRETWKGKWPNECNEFSNFDDGGCLLLYGSVGNGKTHVALATARLWLGNRPASSVGDVVFVDGASFLQAVRGYQHDNPREIGVACNELSNAGLLVVDDLVGMESEWPFTTMRLVLRERHAKERPTIITTNKTPDQIADHDPPLASRLVSGLKVKFTGSDKRFERRSA